MLIIFYDDNGEQFEDYHRSVNKIYDLPVDQISIKKKWNKYFLEQAIIEKIDIKINGDYGFPFLYRNSIKSPKNKYFNTYEPKKSHLKKFRKIENKFYEWLEEKYNCKSIEFKEYQ